MIEKEKQTIICSDPFCKEPSLIFNPKQRHQKCERGITVNQLQDNLSQKIEASEDAKRIISMLDSVVKRVEIIKGQISENKILIASKEEKELLALLKGKEYDRITSELVREVWGKKNPQNLILGKFNQYKADIDQSLNNIEQLILSNKSFIPSSIFSSSNLDSLHKSPTITTFQTTNNQTYAILDPPLSIESISVLTLKLVKGDEASFGIGSKSMIEKNKYKWSAEECGVCVIKCTTGAIYDHMNKVEKIKSNVKVDEGEILEIGYNPIAKSVYFKNKTRDICCEERLDSTEYGDLHFIVHPSMDPPTKVQIMH